MMWKRYIVSALFVASVYSCLACGYCEPDASGTYMFKAYDISSYLQYKEDANFYNVGFWYQYANKEVPRSEVWAALNKCHAIDIENGKNAFFAYLKKKHDSDALTYWETVLGFQDLTGDEWGYAEKIDSAVMREMAKTLESAGTKCKDASLKERFAYQYMRIMFTLSEYKQCRQTWESGGEQWQDTILRKQGRLYYAGALFYTGELCKAADIYGECSDWNSLRFFKNKVDFIQELYKYNPKSKALLFFVQNYENSYQEGKNVDVKKFTELCQQVLKEKKTDNPALWQAALAHIAFIDGDYAKANELIEKANSMNGDPIVKENARYLRLVYHAADTKASNYDDLLYADLTWLLKKVNETEEYYSKNGNGYAHFINILRRVVFVYAFPHYVDVGNHNMAAALLNVYDEVFCYDKEHRAELRKNPNETGSWDYSTFYFNYLDTTSVENVKDFLAFVKSRGKTNLEKSLISMGYVNESMMNELIGTKYMRLHDYVNAIEYLQNVNPSFLKKQNITDYLKRNPFMEDWIAAKNEKGSLYNSIKPTTMYATSSTKLQFCIIMKMLDDKIHSLTDKEECSLLSYAYAVGLVQAERWCWALTQYAQSSDDWNGGLFQSIKNLQTDDNGWDYLSSRSYMLQDQYNKVYSYLDLAEKNTTNSELIARCQYMRGVVELDDSHKWQYYRNLTGKYANTKFVSTERRHCDWLCDHR
ncbi:MAG: hypothetical protein J5709_00895 [Bacteroidales bacterium]|nr:hypothetical protein [Bacteroidales bacterium]